MRVFPQQKPALHNACEVKKQIETALDVLDGLGKVAEARLRVAVKH